MSLLANISSISPNTVSFISSVTHPRRSLSASNDRRDARIVFRAFGHVPLDHADLPLLCFLPS